MTQKQLFQILTFLSIALFCTVSDLWTKSWIFNRLGMPGTTVDVWWQWDRVFGFQTALNEGALFGMGQGFVLLLAGLALMMLFGILWWLFFYRRKNWFLIVNIALIAGGIIGNLYDRLGLHQLRWYDDGVHTPDTPVYAVRDWILVMIGSYHWPNFNLADSYLVCGVILLCIYVFFFSSPEKKDEQAGVSVSK